ncbi:MAG: DUF3810 domain-containing protein, partial [Myxococcota bacterium]
VRGVGPWLAGIPNLLTRWLPFSLAEFVVVGLVLTAIGLVATGVRAWWRGARPTRLGVLRFALWAGVVGFGVADLFTVVWGLSYARPPIEVRMGWEGDLDDIAAGELEALARFLVDEVNDRYLALHGLPDAFVPTSSPEPWPVVDAAIDRGFVAWQARESLHPDLARSRGPAKRLVFSPVTSWLRISGFFFPFTGEANVNQGPPDWQQPFTTAHEKAHQRFFASENEANFAGFLACIHSDDPFVQYGGYLFAQRQVLRTMQRTDPLAFVEQIQRRLPGVQRDVNAAHAFWTGYQGPVGDVSRAVNDAYLRANGVEGGVQSYGRSLQLIARYARERAGRWPPAVEEM